MKMAKARQQGERLLSGGKLDDVIKDYMWRQKYHYHELMVMKQKGINPFELARDKEGKPILDDNGNPTYKAKFRKIVPVTARVFNPKTGKTEEVNIREHNKRVFKSKKK